MTIISRFKKSDDSPGFLLWKLTNLWQAKIRKTLKPLDLTHTQFVLLTNIVYLTDRGFEVTASELSRQTKIDKMMVSDVSKTLETKQLIVKENHEEDARKVYLYPTLKGRLLTNQAIRLVEEIDRDFFEILDQEAYLAITKNLILKNEK